MILAIDIGCIKDNKILFTERMSTDSNETVLEYAIGFKTVLELYHIHTKDLTGSIISSVVPPVTNTIKEALFKITHHQAMVVGPGIRTGLNILTDNPAVTGSDLIVGAVAAIHEYPVPLCCGPQEKLHRRHDHPRHPRLPGRPGQPRLPVKSHQPGCTEEDHRNQHHRLHEERSPLRKRRHARRYRGPHGRRTW